MKREEEEAVLLVMCTFWDPLERRGKTVGTGVGGSDLTLWEVAQPWEGQQVLFSKV